MVAERHGAPGEDRFVDVPGVVVEEREQRSGGVLGAQVPPAGHAEVVLGLDDHRVVEIEPVSGNAVGDDDHLDAHAHLLPSAGDRGAEAVGAVAHREDDHRDVGHDGYRTTTLVPIGAQFQIHNASAVDWRTQPCDSGRPSCSALCSGTPLRFGISWNPMRPPSGP